MTPTQRIIYNQLLKLNYAQSKAHEIATGARPITPHVREELARNGIELA